MKESRNLVAVSTRKTRTDFTVPTICKPERVGSLKIDPVIEFINTRKHHVLEQAIKAVERCAHEEMHRIAHEMGGAIAFYTYTEEGRALSELSRWLEGNPHMAVSEIEQRRQAILELLRNTRERRARHGK